MLAEQLPSVRDIGIKFLGLLALAIRTPTDPLSAGSVVSVCSPLPGTDMDGECATYVYAQQRAL